MTTSKTSPRLADFFPLCRSLARRFAWEPDDVGDLYQEGIIAWHKALQKWPNPPKPEAFARTVMSRAMKAYYPASRRNGAHRVVSYDELIDSQEDSDYGPSTLPTALVVPAPEPEQAGLLDNFLGDLEATCGKQARFAAECLICPGESFARYVLLEVEEKRRARENNDGPKPRGIDRIRISHRQIREALGLTTPRWMSLLSEIRSFAADWLQLRGTTPESHDDPQQQLISPLLTTLPKEPIKSK